MVILISLVEPYTLNELDLKLLYVAMTRPLHHLVFFSRPGHIPLLETDTIQVHETTHDVPDSR